MSKYRCLNCHSLNLIEGKLVGEIPAFQPNDFVWACYSPKAFVCMDCGFLTQYLDPTQIQSIRNKLES